MGGLGNQLFQLAAAFHLRDVLRRQVVLDRQFYSVTHADMDPRDFEIDELPHGFTVIRGRGRSTRLRALPRALQSRITTRGARVVLFNDAVAEARALGFSDPAAKGLIELSENEPPFFQSTFAPLMNAATMRSLLESRIPLAFQPEADSPYIGVHSRLGDYLNDRWRNDLGPTDPAQLLELGRQLSQNHGGLPIRVFTDSPDVFEQLCPESKIGPYEISDAVSSWDALTAMARSHAFVMANSTLSWWAAFIATISRPEPVDVHFPFPWYVNPSHTDELIGIPGWTRYERRLLPETASFPPSEL
ncbi:unannotated protein [freshwater metagenome]|uniref:Unannotated protein n=1 Tax=freshwater metagenome TaxID=449393 RepID=A0A6J7JJ93_9ZZZZ